MSESRVDTTKLLDYLPEYPRKVSVEFLINQFNSNATGRVKANLRRNIERALNELRKNPEYRIDYKKVGDSRKWFWVEGKNHNISNMSESTALAFLMAEERLMEALPPVAITELKPWFQHAKWKLQESNKEKARWKEKIRFMPTSLGSPPPLKPEIMNPIYKSLLEDKKLELTYLAPNNSQPKTYPVNPLGLIFTEEGSYLSCTIKERSDPTSLNLRRIRDAKSLHEKVIIPPKYNIDEAKSQFQHGYSDTPIKLVMQLSKDALMRFRESPWVEEKKCEFKDLDNEWSQITLPIKDSAVLRKKIKSMGDKVIIKKPEKIRKDMLETAKNLIALYE